MSTPAGPVRAHSLGSNNIHNHASKYHVAHKFQRRDSSPLMPEDFEDIALEPSNFNNRSFSDTASTQSLSSRDSVASSTSTAALDEEYETDATSTTSSVLIDPHKLNGYAINSFKSKSVHSLHLNNNSHLSASRDSLSAGDLKHNLPLHTPRPTSQPPHVASNATTAGAKNNTNNNVLSRQRSMINLPHRPHSHTLSNRPFDNLAPLTTSFGGSSTSSAEISHIPASGSSVVPSRRQVQQKPLLRKAISTSRLSTGSIDTSGLDTNVGSGLPPHRLKSRTGSVRLTRRQIEAQFEADDDVLDDSCIWNVPLSPALYAQSKKLATAQKRPPPLPTKSSQKNRSQPSLHEMPMISETEAVTEFVDPLEPDVRGLEGLDRDVQELTRKFEELPEDFSLGNRRASDPVKLASCRSSRLSIGSTASSTPATPLSQTRPSWLPPKSAEEEKKHMKQFHDMLEQAVIAEKKKEEALKCRQEAKQRQEKKDEEEWTKHVLPKFDTAIKDAKTRELWWRGIPERLREQVWKQKVGNELKITNDVFRASMSKSVDGQVLKQIDQDAGEVFPELHIFGKTSPLHEDLVNIVRAYCSYRPDVGYQPGLVKIGAVLLLNLAPFDAFVVMANLLDKSISVAIWKKEERLLSGFYSSFLKVLHTKLPKLYEHFQHIRLAPSAYLEPPTQSWFVEHLHIDIVKRIVDVMVFEGDGFLLRVALGVLNVLEFKLYGNAQEVLAELSPSSNLDVGDEDEFMAAVRLALRA